MPHSAILRECRALHCPTKRMRMRKRSSSFSPSAVGLGVEIVCWQEAMSEKRLAAAAWSSGPREGRCVGETELPPPSKRYSLRPRDGYHRLPRAGGWRWPAVAFAGRSPVATDLTLRRRSLRQLLTGCSSVDQPAICWWWRRAGPLRRAASRGGFRQIATRTRSRSPELADQHR